MKLIFNDTAQLIRDGVPIAPISGKLVSLPEGLRNDRIIRYSHALDCEITTDIQDGLTRPANTNTWQYTDGDLVTMAGQNFVVVYVDLLNPGTRFARKRAYLLRDSVAEVITLP
jgi:hypothetical protein